MDWRQKFGAGVRRVGTVLRLGWLHALCSVSNLRRRLFRRQLPDYVLFVLDQDLVERSQVLPWWATLLPRPVVTYSLESLSHALRRIAADPDVQGVVFLFKSPGLSLARAQSFAALIGHFRRWDEESLRTDRVLESKRVIAYLEQIDTATYVAACAADLVVAPPQASWDIVGLRAMPTFWKESLARLGIQFDVVRVAPWKTAFDALSQDEMSPQYREQVEWLLDSLYQSTVAAIAAGRTLSPEAVTAQIDRAPLTAPEAHQAGLLDQIAYEDELPALLGDGEQEAGIVPYAKASRLLWRRPVLRHVQAVGVLSLTGAIMPGHSRGFPLPLPLLGRALIGSSTVQQQVRALRRDRRLAAVIVHVDSGGGSALASDLIWRELHLLRQEKPVVVYLGDVAASGGYYVALPGSKLIAQPATLTGSIGVIVAKPVLAGAYAKLGAQRDAVGRGRHAGLYGDDAPWTDEERSRVEEGVRHVYDEFTRRVADSRGLADDALEAVCGGRVWTGAQAMERGLVDALGDFHAAMDAACELANLPKDGTVAALPVGGERGYLTAYPAAVADVARTRLGWDQLAAWSWAALQGDWQAVLGRERFWLIAAELPRILY